MFISLPLYPSLRSPLLHSGLCWLRQWFVRQIINHAGLSHGVTFKSKSLDKAERLAFLCG